MTRLPTLLVLLAACSLGRTVGTEPGPASPGPAVSAVDGLMSARDRAALAQVSAAREGARFEDGYRLGPEDLLDIRIPNLGGIREAQVPQAGSTPTPVAEPPVFAQGYRVGADGTINLALLGAVHVAGLTTAELERHLAERLIAEDILRDPQVNVLVVEYRSRVAAVVGSVERPGLYPITRPGMRLADLVWAAGGPSRDAGRVLEFRPVPDATRRPAGLPSPLSPGAPPATHSLGVARLDVERMGGRLRVRITLPRPPEDVQSFTLDAPPRLVIDIGRADGTPSAEVRTGDELVQGVRIATHGSGMRVVLDLARSPDEQSVRTEGATIVVDLGDVAPSNAVAIAQSAPAAPTATASDGLLVRVDLGVLLEHAGETTLNPKILAGDVVNLSPAGSVLVDGWVDKPGSYPVTRGLTLSGAIAAAGGHLFPADRHHATVKRTLGSGEERSFVVDLHAVTEGRASDLPIADGDVVRLPASPMRVVPWGVFAIARELVHIGGTVALF